MTNLQEHLELLSVPEELGQRDYSDHLTVRERVELLAYLLYERRGRIDGFDLQDWLAAEREVLAEEGIH